MNKRQHHFCVSVFKKTKRNFYNNLNENEITNNGSLWKTLEPNFTEKNTKRWKIILVENDKTISEEIKVVKTFFDSFVDGFNVIYCKVPKINAIKTFERHPCNLKIGRV